MLAGQGGPTGAEASRTDDILGLIAELDQRISHLTFAEITRGALAFLCERLGLLRTSVALLDHDGQSFRIFDTTVDISGIESGKVIPLASASLGATVERRAMVYRPDIRQWPANPVDDALLAAGIHSTVSVPLLCAGRCLGTLNGAATAVDGISPITRQILGLIAPRLAFAINVGIVHDQLTESEQRFRDVFAHVGDGIIVADIASRRIVMVNASTCSMLGRSEPELLGLTIAALHPPDRLDEVVATFSAMVEGHLDHALEIPMVRADGSVLVADVAARNTSVGGRPSVVGVFRDATLRRRRQQEEVQLQRLESIRTLAAGIAHDFNNLLTGLIGYMSLVQPHLPPGEEPWEMLDEAQRAAGRATALTRQLLTFAKGGAPVRRVTDLIPIVHDSARLAASGSNVQCRFDFPQCPVMVDGDEGQLAQVFSNLVRNAVEAMPDGGTARIRLTVRAALPVGAGAEACVEVADDGVGIDPANLERVFLPFFTTKATGSGLGLAAAYSIVQGHQGRIEVESGQGRGTTFLVSLPVVEAGAEPIAAVVAASSATGRVLVMDDQAVVRHVAERALRAAGYDPCTVVEGEAAVAAYRNARASGHAFCAAILDLTIPGGMGGREVAAAILALDPDARLIVSSGYSDDAAMADYRRHGFCAILPKPYAAEQLRAAVARAVRG
jgi:PAS domain S-box-containing protein